MSKKAKNTNSSSIVIFSYSYPYEGTLLALAGQKHSKKHDQIGYKKAKYAQKIWDKYEKKILSLFEKMYKMKIDEKFIAVFISLIMPNSFSHPMTISLKRFPEIESNWIHKRAFLFTTIHELAHYFSYTRPESSYINKLIDKIWKKDLLGGKGANLHYIIQAVEFGIGAEAVDKKAAVFRRKFVAEKWKIGEYSKSAQALIDHKVPLDKSCLDYIEKKILM